MRNVWALLAAFVAGVTLLVGHGLLQLPAPVLFAFIVILARIAAPASQIQLGLQQIAYSLPAWEDLKEIERELAASAAVRAASWSAPGV